MNLMLTNRLTSWPARNLGTRLSPPPSPVLGLLVCSATPGFSLGCWRVWRQILMSTQQALSHQAISSASGLCVLTETKYAVQNSWRGTIFTHLTSAVKKTTSASQVAKEFYKPDRNQSGEEPLSSCHRLTGHPFWSSLLAMVPDLQASRS